MATALVTQIAYAVQTLFDPAGTAGRLVDLGKLANYGLLTSFTPAYLFTVGVNGAWYDPSDITTLYQDAAGTIPVTAMEQPVGLMLDKSKGAVPGANVSDLAELTTTGTGSTTLFTATTAGWYALSANIVSGTGTTGWSVVSPAYTGPKEAAGNSITAIVYVNAGSAVQLSSSSASSLRTTRIAVQALAGNHAFNPSGNSANFPILKQDEFGKKYLSFNGTNQWLQTNSIDFSYGDKMFVCAGVRKLGGTGGALTELSVNYDQNNAFAIFAPSTLKDAYGWRTRGTSTVILDSISLQPSPTTNVVSGISNIAAPQAILRINGSQDSISTASQGTGNFGNYPLYIGARAGSSLWFNGRLYGMVIAGKQASDAEITATETFINQKTGAY